MSLRVLNPGLYSILVDSGRPGSRSLGVPFGGAADRASFQVGNALVGNPINSVALEMTVRGPALRAIRPVSGVVFGSAFEIQTTHRRLVPGKTFVLAQNEELHIRGTATGARGYLCVAGGFQTARILNSGSGIQPIRRDDILVVDSLIPMLPRSLGAVRLEDECPANCLRFVAGTHASWFDRERFVREEYRVSPSSNRMGVRLDGGRLQPTTRELPSEPVCPGTVQVTRDGKCIILGMDGQTIGGYPRIAQVISADLDRIAQLRPGDGIRFLEVGLAEAEAALHRRRVLLNQWLVRLQTAEIFTSGYTDSPSVSRSHTLLQNTPVSE